MASEPANSISHHEDLPDRHADAERLARAVLAEDGSRDITGEVVGCAGPGVGTVRTREAAVVACLDYASAVASATGCRMEWSVAEGDRVAADATPGTISGDVADILRAERPILNLLQRACGIATATRRFVDAVSGTSCRVLHTRKTAPGLRLFDVAAVVAGGGHVHRLDLEQVVMIKDNHWASLDAQGRGLGATVEEARRRGVAVVQVEVESESQVAAACEAGANRLLIDNLPPEQFARLANLAHRCAPAVEIEATGGITLETVRAYALAGAGFVSVGALTHSVKAVDLTLEL